MEFGFGKKVKVSSAPISDTNHPDDKSIKSGEPNNPKDQPAAEQGPVAVPVSEPGTSSGISMASPTPNLEASPNDIAAYIGKHLTDENKYSILKQLWRPETSFKFPFTKFGNKNRAFQVIKNLTMIYKLK